MINYTPGIDLKIYNCNILSALRKRLGEPNLTKIMQTFTKSIDHLFSNLSEYYAPRAFIIISVANGWQAFDRLFQYINGLLNPSEELLKEINAHKAKINEQL